MKRYFVKEVSKATDNNPKFAGAISVGYFGKGDTLVANADIEHIDRYCEGMNADIEHTDRYCEGMVVFFENISNVMLAEYGYSRKCDASKNWTYNNPENTEYWQSTVEIVEVEV